MMIPSMAGNHVGKMYLPWQSYRCLKFPSLDKHPPVTELIFNFLRLVDGS